MLQKATRPEKWIRAGGRASRPDDNQGQAQGYGPVQPGPGPRQGARAGVASASKGCRARVGGASMALCSSSKLLWYSSFSCFSCCSSSTSVRVRVSVFVGYIGEADEAENNGNSVEEGLREGDKAVRRKMITISVGDGQKQPGLGSGFRAGLMFVTSLG